MRHITSFIAGIVIGIIAWLLIGTAQYRLGMAAVTGTATSGWGHYWLPLLLLAIAGVLLGFITATRISPIGAFLAGAGYVILQVFYVTAPGFLSWLPSDVFGQLDVWNRPMRSGIFAVLGPLMLIAVFSRRRWQRWPTGRTGRHAEPVGTTAGTGLGAGAGIGQMSDTRHFPLPDDRTWAGGTEHPTYQMPADNPTIGQPPKPPDPTDPHRPTQ